MPSNTLTFAHIEALMAQIPEPPAFLMNPSEWAAWRSTVSRLGVVASESKGLPFEQIELWVWRTETPFRGPTCFAHVYLDALVPEGKVLDVRDNAMRKVLAERWYRQMPKDAALAATPRDTSGAVTSDGGESDQS